jgi:hypothetical protein
MVPGTLLINMLYKIYLAFVFTQTIKVGEILYLKKIN